MRFRCLQKNLLEGIQTVHNVISTRSTLPILANVLMETTKQKARFTATDLDIGIISDIEVQVDEEGAITTPAKKFLDVVRELPGDHEITIATPKHNTITIETGKLFFKIISLPKEEFPKLPEFKNPETITLKQHTLKQMLLKTSFAISHEETRYVLNGVLFSIGPKNLKLVATDGRRLALIQKETDIPKQFASSPQKIIVPIKATHELLRTLSEEGEVKIKLDKNQILFDLGKAVIITRLIEGEFPDYERVIPKKQSHPIKINKNQLLSATKRAGIFTTQQSQGVRLEIAKNKIRVSKTSPEFGEVKEEVDMMYNGPNLTIGVNPNYLTDVLKTLDLEDIDLEFTSPEKPGVIRIGDEYTYVVLPMQIA